MTTPRLPGSATVRSPDRRSRTAGSRPAASYSNAPQSTGSCPASASACSRWALSSNPAWSLPTKTRMTASLSGCRAVAVLGVDGWRGRWVGALLDGRTVTLLDLPDAAAVLAVPDVDVVGDRHADRAVGRRRPRVRRRGPAPARPRRAARSSPRRCARCSAAPTYDGRLPRSRARRRARRCRCRPGTWCPAIRSPRRRPRRPAGPARARGRTPSWRSARSTPRVTAPQGHRRAGSPSGSARWSRCMDVLDALAAAPPGVPVVDCLDACAAAWSAQRIADGAAECVGDGSRDSRGRPMRICLVSAPAGHEVADGVLVRRHAVAGPQLRAGPRRRRLPRRRHPIAPGRGGRPDRGGPRGDPAPVDRGEHPRPLRPLLRQRGLPAGGRSGRPRGCAASSAGHRRSGSGPPRRGAAGRGDDDDAELRRRPPRSTCPTGWSTTSPCSTSAAGRSCCASSAAGTPTTTWWSRSRPTATATVVFAGDLVEEGAPPAFEDALPAEWPATLGRLHALARGPVVPGHGAVVDAGFVGAQREELLAVLTALRDGPPGPGALRRRDDGRRPRSRPPLTAVDTAAAS